MAHLDDLAELSHQSEEEEGVVIHQLFVTVNEAFFCKVSHRNRLVILRSREVL